MRIAYLDCAMGFNPTAGLAALLDLGADVRRMEEALATLVLGPFRLARTRARKDGVAWTRLRIETGRGAPRLERPSEVARALERSGLPSRARAWAGRAYSLLARAEAKAHRVPLKGIHFHEVGDPRSILAVAGFLAALTLLGIKTVFASPLPSSRGWVRTEHGILRLPTPATAHLLRDVPSLPAPVEGELVSPSGAAVLKAVSRAFGPTPPMTVARTGHGTGRGPARVRVLVGESLGR